MDFTNYLVQNFHADADRRMAFICRVMMALLALVIVLVGTRAYQRTGRFVYQAQTMGVNISRPSARCLTTM